MTKEEFEQNVVRVYQIQFNYDGWSVALLKDGTLFNRWEPDSPFYKKAQEFIEQMKGEHIES